MKFQDKISEIQKDIEDNTREAKRELLRMNQYLVRFQYLTKSEGVLTDIPIKEFKDMNDNQINEEILNNIKNRKGVRRFLNNINEVRDQLLMEEHKDHSSLLDIKFKIEKIISTMKESNRKIK